MKAFLYPQMYKSEIPDGSWPNPEGSREGERPSGGELGRSEGSVALPPAGWGTSTWGSTSLHPAPTLHP